MITAVSISKKHTWQWVVFVAGVATLLWFLNSQSRIVPNHYSRSMYSRSLTPDTLGKDWFFILKMPEVSQQLIDPTGAQIKLDQWLSALIESGYKPMLLSEVLGRLQRKQSLPERAVVISFDPGYRQTYEVYSKVLQQRKIPALWVTNENAIRQAHMGYLSRHQLNLMDKSGAWDIAMKNSSGKFKFITKNQATLTALKDLKAKKLIFDSERTAFNASINSPSFNRLSINGNWTDTELVTRLDAEMPVHEKSYLTAESIQGRRWGTALPVSDHVNPPQVFDLLAEPMKRFGYVSWLGTGGIKDFNLDLHVGQVDGELWIFLRSRPETDERLAIGFTAEGWVVEEQKRGDKRLLGRATEPVLEGPLDVRVELHQQTLKIFSQGQERLALAKLENIPIDGIIELLVYDKVRAAAQAKSVSLVLTPEKN